jgi:hypothetical protein
LGPILTERFAKQLPPPRGPGEKEVVEELVVPEERHVMV